jgi:hypothetical protein
MFGNDVNPGMGVKVLATVAVFGSKWLVSARATAGGRCRRQRGRHFRREN